MGSVFKRRLRVRTAAMFLLASVVPVLMTGIAVFAQMRSTLVERVLDSHRSLIRQMDKDIDSAFSLHMRLVQALARQIDVQTLDPSRVKPHLDTFLDYDLLFHEIAAHDASGNLISRSSRGALGLGTSPTSDLGNRGMIDEVLANGKPYLSRPITDAAGHVRLEMMVPIPAFVDGEPTQGVITAHLRLHGSEIQTLLDDFSFVGDTYLLLTDDSGRVLGRVGGEHLGSVRHIRVRSDDDREQHHEDTSSTGASGKNIRTGLAIVGGRRDLLAESSIPSLGLVMIVGKPCSEVDDFLHGTIQSVVFYGIVGVLLALILSIGFSQSLTRPILVLTNGIRKVARGEVAHRIPVDREDELGVAGDAFNSMATSLQKGRLLEEIWTTRRSERHG